MSEDPLVLARMKQALALRAKGLDFWDIGLQLTRPGARKHCKPGDWVIDGPASEVLLQKALSLARKTLQSYDFGEEGPTPGVCARAFRVLDSLEDAQKPEHQGLTLEQMTMPVDDLELSCRAQNCLKNANISTVGELVLWTAKDLLKVKNCGRKSVDEIRDELARLGLRLKGDY